MTRRKEVEIASFANNPHETSSYVQLMRKKEIIEKERYASGLILAFSIGLLIFSMLAFFKTLGV